MINVLIRQKWESEVGVLSNYVPKDYVTLQRILCVGLCIWNHVHHTISYVLMIKYYFCHIMVIKYNLYTNLNR